MNTPRTDKLVERLNVEPWLSTETKCRSLHAFAQSLEVENAKLRAAVGDPNSTTVSGDVMTPYRNHKPNTL